MNKPKDIALRFYVVLCMAAKGFDKDILDETSWSEVGKNIGFSGRTDPLVEEVHKALPNPDAFWHWNAVPRKVFPQVTKLILGDEDEPSVESKTATAANNGTSPGQGVQSA